MPNLGSALGVATLGGSAYESEAMALFARFTTAPDSVRKRHINTLIKSLKSGGVWTKLDALYLMAAANAQAAQRNWIANQYNLTESSSPTFTADQGYTGDGAAAYLDTGFNPATAGGLFVQDSHSFGAWLRTGNADATSVFEMGQSNCAIAPFGTSGVAYFARSAASTSDQFNFRPNGGTLYGAHRSASGGYSVSQGAAKAALGLANTRNSGNIYVGHGQGWTTDGTYYYTFESGAIRKRSTADWSIVSSNTSPFTSLNGSPNHLGSGVYYNGKLYVGVEYWSGSCGGANTDFQIVVYDASTLAFIETHSVSVTELAGVAIDPTAGIIYGVSFCDSSVIYRWDLSTFAALTSISLDSAGEFHFVSLQGIAWDTATNLLYVAGNGGSGLGATNNYVIGVNTSGQIRRIWRIAETSGAIEGLNFDTNGQLGVMLDDSAASQIVYFYDIPTESATSFTRTSAALPSSAFTIFKRNGASAFSTNQISAAFIGGNLTQEQLATLYNAIRTYLVAVGAA